MIDEIVELKKIYYKLQSNIDYSLRLSEIGALPEECLLQLKKDVNLADLLKQLIDKFEIMEG